MFYTMALNLFKLVKLCIKKTLLAHLHKLTVITNHAWAEYRLLLAYYTSFIVKGR